MPASLVDWIAWMKRRSNHQFYWAYHWMEVLLCPWGAPLERTIRLQAIATRNKLCQGSVARHWLQGYPRGDPLHGSSGQWNGWDLGQKFRIASCNWNLEVTCCCWSGSYCKNAKGKWDCFCSSLWVLSHGPESWSWVMVLSHGSQSWGGSEVVSVNVIGWINYKLLMISNNDCTSTQEAGGMHQSTPRKIPVEVQYRTGTWLRI